jgi:two-component system, cell cycle sensor histidine kinase and response regulator CckA
MTSILIAEDTPTQAAQLADVLESEGFCVMTAPDGETALRFLETEKIDLVISDVVMPRMSGYEICRSVKASHRDRDAPILLVTSLSDPMEVIRGLECGADGFLRKPYRPEDLVNRIRRILDNVQIRRASHVTSGIEIAFLGKRFVVTSGREQILDLLVSTFEDAIRANRELEQSRAALAAAHAQVQRHARNLEDRVRKRTAALSASAKRAETAEALLRDAIDSMSGRLIVCDRNDRIVVANRDMENSFPDCVDLLRGGSTYEEFLRAAVSRGYFLEAVGREEEWIAARMTAHRSTSSTREYRQKDGRWVLITEKRTSDGGTAMIGIDVTRRKETQAALAASEERLDRAQSIARIGSWELDLVTGRMIWSQEMYRLCGLSAEGDVLIGSDFSRCVALEHEERVRGWIERLAAGDRPPAIECQLASADEKARHAILEGTEVLDERGKVVRIAGTLREVTEQRLIERQLAQAQKMEAIGNLTGGLAHDFNNLLGIIIGNLDILRDTPLEPSQVAELAQDALDAALRGADLTRRLLAFARRQSLSPEHVSVNDLVANIAKLLNRTLGEDVEIGLNLSQGLWPTYVDPTQLESAITNLATNARDAMPKGGHLTITTRNVALDAEYTTEHIDVVPGDYVLIEVSDTGQGIPPNVIGHIFEPFFTTKGQGKGTGLGLSMVFGFIRQSGGHVNVYSEVGEGTTFRLYLPRDLGDARRPAQRTILANPMGSGETILLVEDNAKLLNIAVRQLSDLGYRLLTAENPADAKEIIDRDEPIDLLLTDIVMPGGLSGIDLARQASARQPRLRILLTSGFPDAHFGEDRNRALAWPLLSKPYRKEDLARAVREALDGRAATHAKR